MKYPLVKFHPLRKKLLPPFLAKQLRVLFSLFQVTFLRNASILRQELVKSFVQSNCLWSRLFSAQYLKARGLVGGICQQNQFGNTTKISFSFVLDLGIQWRGGRKCKLSSIYMCARPAVHVLMSEELQVLLFSCSFLHFIENDVSASNM